MGAIYLNAVTVGIGLSITFVMFNTNRNNIADLIEWQSGRRIDSLVSTGDNLAAKLAQAGATQLLTLSLHMAGFNEALPAQPDATIATINALLGWVPAAVTLCDAGCSVRDEHRKGHGQHERGKSRSGNLCLRLTDVQSQASG